MKYMIGTRGSKLALAQAKDVCFRLQKAYPEHSFECKVIQTKGDQIQNKPLDQIGDKGVFVKEIESQILSGEVQIGVHSMKDMPAHPAEGLIFTKAWKREEPRDVLILREKGALSELPQGAVIGTGSRRREYQLKRIRPDLKIVNIRGNVDTRLRKMEEQKLDGIVLAAAGLHRLGMEDRITQYLEIEQMIPAPAQGILALEILEGDTETARLLDALCDGETEVAVCAERGFLKAIGGDCHVPIGAICEKMEDGKYQMHTMFGNEDGTKLAFASVIGEDPKQLALGAKEEIQRQLSEDIMSNVTLPMDKELEKKVDRNKEVGVEKNIGTVFLVGGGPGDPELITVKGLTALREADCIVYDRLSSPELLLEAKPDCELIYVGKENHNHTMRQEEINKLLVKKAGEHEKIVRFKGGDIYVFGRGGEEALALEKEGIPFEVIPGISSCIAGLAYAGIPITHRGISSGFHVVTAHNQRDELADIDFTAMARGTDTCVFLMGLGKVREIAKRLMEAGMSPETPAAVISKATTSKQRTVTAELVQIADEVERAKLSSPALIVVGNVVTLREKLNRFEKQFDSKKRYLVSKIGKKTSDLAVYLREQGKIVDEIQVGEIVSLPFSVTKEQIEKVDWLVFTSRNGVKAFFDTFLQERLDVRCLARCQIASIGEQTSKALRTYGICPDLQPQEFHSDALIEKLKEQVKKEQILWYLKARNADSHLAQELKGSCQVEEIPIYENQAVTSVLPLKERIKEYDGIFFTCASSVEWLFSTVGKDVWQSWNENGICYSIGLKTTECLKGFGASHIVQAEQASYESLARCVSDKVL